ncbi:ribonuclease HI family protein [Candidatus Kuenenbacteria bacterium]|nr:ribonuclease HI family protein [Candidatus Kuenenbacteria bacterium]
MKLKIFTDGGARGNPGPGGIGVVIKYDNKVLEFSKYIGNSTNNQAEYKAVILALEEAKKLSAKEINFYLDSELVVNQLNRKYKIKNQELSFLFIQIWNLSSNFNKITYNYISREQNKEADRLVNLALDDQNKL